MCERHLNTSCQLIESLQHRSHSSLLHPAFALFAIINENAIITEYFPGIPASQASQVLTNHRDCSIMITGRSQRRRPSYEMQLYTFTAEEARSGAAAAGFDSLESAFVEFLTNLKPKSLWQSFLSSRRLAREAQLRSRFKSAGLWSEWAPGEGALAMERIRGLLAQLQRQIPAQHSGDWKGRQQS